MTEQITLDEAMARADDGMRRSLENAESEIAGWGDLAFRYIEFFCSTRKGKRFIGRDVVIASKDYGLIQAPNDKAWGAVIQRAAKYKLIVRVGTTKDANRHGNPIPLWEAC